MAEPPPDTIATFALRLGRRPRDDVVLQVDGELGCDASATPFRDSTRTSSGALMSFFIVRSPLILGISFAQSESNSLMSNMLGACRVVKIILKTGGTRTGSTTHRKEAPPVIQAIDRAAKILDLLQGARHLGITDLAAALSLPPSTVHGIVKSLRSHGLVAKERGGQRYMLGPTLLRLSNVYLDTLDVRARAMRWTQELARRTRPLRAARRPPLHRRARHPPQPSSRRQPADARDRRRHPRARLRDGQGAARLRPGIQQSVFEQPLRSLTGDTITDVARLTLELPAIAERGTAGEFDEAVLGESSLAAPVADASNDIVAAVAVVLPTSQTPASDAIMNALRETARNISRELGATSWPPRVAPADD